MRLVQSYIIGFIKSKGYTSNVILYLLQSVDCHSFSIQSHRKVFHSLFKPSAIIIGASMFCLDCPLFLSLDGAVALAIVWLMTMIGSFTERFPQLFWHIRKSKYLFPFFTSPPSSF